jgi:hypothetical protein
VPFFRRWRFEMKLSPFGGDNTTTYYSFLIKFRIAGNDPNTIWQTSISQPSICFTSIGNSGVKQQPDLGDSVLILITMLIQDVHQKLLELHVFIMEVLML